MSSPSRNKLNSNKIAKDTQLFYGSQTITTGSTYGEVTVYHSIKKQPAYANCVIDNANYIACANNINSQLVQFIIRKVTDGTPVLNTNITMRFIICWH